MNKPRLLYLGYDGTYTLSRTAPTVVHHYGLDYFAAPGMCAMEPGEAGPLAALKLEKFEVVRLVVQRPKRRKGRRSLSVSADAFRLIEAAAKQRNWSVSQLVEEALRGV
jgi:hypothetical protein